MAVSLQSSCDAAPCLMPLCLAMATGSSDVGRGAAAAAAALEHQASCTAHPPGCLHPVSRGVFAPLASRPPTVPLFRVITGGAALPGWTWMPSLGRGSTHGLCLGTCRTAWPGTTSTGRSNPHFHRQAHSTLPQADPESASPPGPSPFIPAALKPGPTYPPPSPHRPTNLTAQAAAEVGR